MTVTMPATLPETRTTASLTLTPVSPFVAHLTAGSAKDWTPHSVWRYVTEELRRIHGAQLPAGDTEAILGEFCQRFGIEDAVRIVRAAFEVFGGMWQGAPVTIKRFLAGHDEFFAHPLLASCS